MILIEEYFRQYPARKKVAEFLLRNGVSVRNGHPNLSGAKLSISEVAKASGANRKVVYYTVEIIESTSALRLLFERIEPELKVESIAPVMNWEVLQVEVEKKPTKVLQNLLGVILDEGNEVVSVSMKSLPGEETQLSIVLEKPLKGETLKKMGEIPGIRRILIKTPEKDKTKLVRTFCEVVYCPRRGDDNVED